MYYHTATKCPYRLYGARISWTTTLAGESYHNLALFVFQFICIFLFFPMKFHIIKQEKWRIPVFERKFRWVSYGGLKKFLGFQQKSYPFRYAFLLQYKSANGFMAFCKNKMFVKNLVLELWSKNLKTNQNGGSFKLQCPTKNLRYNFGYDQRSKKALNITWMLQVGVLSHA